MAIQFDVGELSSELAKLRSRPQLHKLAIVLPISPAKREVAWDFLAEGQPFDIQAIGLDSTAPREAGNVGGANVEGAEDPRGVVRHPSPRRRDVGASPSAPPRGCRRQSGGSGRIAVELELPRLDDVAGPTDQQDVRIFADLLGPDAEIARAYALAHSSPAPVGRASAPCARRACAGRRRV